MISHIWRSPGLKMLTILAVFAAITPSAFGKQKVTVQENPPLDSIVTSCELAAERISLLDRGGEEAIHSKFGKTNVSSRPRLSAAISKITTDCECVGWGDVNLDGMVNPVDVVVMVNHVYRSLDDRQGPELCGFIPGDINCDWAINPVDVVLHVDYVYKNQLHAVCDPCTEDILITDITGMDWDISHAVHHYGMEPDSFWFGLGPNYILPLILPDMLSPGDPGYPDPLSDEEVLGAVINGDARAYPIRIMRSVEVVNDIVGGEPVAITY